MCIKTSELQIIDMRKSRAKIVDKQSLNVETKHRKSKKSAFRYIGERDVEATPEIDDIHTSGNPYITTSMKKMKERRRNTSHDDGIVFVDVRAQTNSKKQSKVKNKQIEQEESQVHTKSKTTKSKKKKVRAKSNVTVETRTNENSNI